LAFQEGGTCPTPPTLLLRATVYRSHHQWICTGYSSQQAQSPPPPASLKEHIDQLPQSIKWCIAHFWSEDNGELIANAITQHTAIALSDGSYKDSRGASAWVLEADSSVGRIKGWTMVPGTTEDHSAYRSELTGLLAILVFIEELCTFHNISSGGITIGCDGLSALHQAEGDADIVPLSTTDYDILCVIRLRLLRVPIQVSFQHVRGHQDDTKSMSSLTRWERLNVEMDSLAKAALQYFTNYPPHSTIAEEPWSIWVQNTKIISNIHSTIADIVHSPAAKSYWINRGKLTDSSAPHTNWRAINHAMASAPKRYNRFISKHASGMCGVGKFLVRWKESDTDACPRCGLREDATHVWICRAPEATSTWHQSLATLRQWMNSVQTDPDITASIIEYLEAWRNDTRPTNNYLPHILHSLQAQDEIGWQQMLEGFQHLSWEEIQARYYRSIRSLRTGRRWASQLIQKLWGVAWDMWEHRNGVLHKQNQGHSQYETRSLDTQLKTLYLSLQGTLPPSDTYLFTDPLSTLLKRSFRLKREWLHQAKSAQSRQQRRITQSTRDTDRQSPYEFQCMLRGMQRTMSTWLRNEIGASTTPPPQQEHE
jgi:hypothetical protein